MFDIVLTLVSLYQVGPHPSLFRNSTGVGEKDRQGPIKLLNSLADKLADNLKEISDSDDGLPAKC